MSSSFGCDHVAALAPELALGTAVGEERSRALEHLSTCASCRRLVSELSALTDEIIALAPAGEPPAGFESRVLDKFSETKRKERRWAFAAIAAVLGAAVAATALFFTFRDERDIASHYRAALDVAHGEYFGVRPLMSSDGMQEGYLFVYEGSPSWIFLVLDDSDEGPYEVAANMRGGETVGLGSFELSEGKQSWGTTVTLELNDLMHLRVTEGGANEDLTAKVARS
jgi:hypothetical protein